jgi:hypothetical protein
MKSTIYIPKLCKVGFKIIDWISDLKSRFAVLNYNVEVERLNVLEKRLETKKRKELEEILKQI